MVYVVVLTSTRTLHRVNFIGERLLKVHSAQQPSHAMMRNPRGTERADPSGRALAQLTVLAPGIRRRAHVDTRLCKHRSKRPQGRHADAFLKQAHHPFAISRVPPP